MLELLGRIAQIGLCLAALRFTWWAPLVVAPLYNLTLGGLLYSRPIEADSLRLAADVLVWISYVAYVVGAILLAGLNLHAWYGWVIGPVVGLGVGHVLGLLFPRRWHLERASLGKPDAF